ncbi:glutaredoxin family protein [Rossellomorea yichunensis]|jgi:glutaredoxin|uniref:glutaredoxin family protein n=1 Tax=Rossellomorea yichunensis TaxID=3077331 RepID=UPI0028E0102A|nr:glutaredoxin family protein [Rossellomorea sp. YC4-1]MDT9026362.1 glutaredoxin family protein [Rossellomorea sp. YC4-1]
MKQVLFYTRNQCGLCQDAKITLKLLEDELGFEIKEIDIDENDDLTERFGLMIPVVEMEGEILQYGQIDYFTLSKRLHEKTR